MREILFRGKRADNGGWVEGNLAYSDNIEPAIYFEFGKGTVKAFDFVYVKPETVGQYTGLTDKNGQKVFEGDVFNLGDMNILYLVVWHDAGFKGKQIRSTSYVGLDYWKDRIEVIGNIHDQKEGA